MYVHRLRPGTPASMPPSVVDLIHASQSHYILPGVLTLLPIVLESIKNLCPLLPKRSSPCLSEQLVITLRGKGSSVQRIALGIPNVTTASFATRLILLARVHQVRHQPL